MDSKKQQETVFKLLLVPEIISNNNTLQKVTFAGTLSTYWVSFWTIQPNRSLKIERTSVGKIVVETYYICLLTCALLTDLPILHFR
jgi:hypothetical protein